MSDIMGYVSRPTALLLVIAALYAAVAGGLRSFTVPATLAVLGPVVLLAGIALAGRVRRLPAPDRLPPRWPLWLVPAMAFAAVESLSLLVWHSSHDHPSLSIVLDAPLEVHPIRSLAVLGWLAAGWALVRR
jgi:hypothetical protein